MFTIRGLCEAEERIDREYILLRETLNTNNIQMMGLSGLTNIIFDSSTKSWKIITLDQSKSILGYCIGVDEWPIGLKEWHLNGSCDSKTEGKNTTILKITKVCLTLINESKFKMYLFSYIINH